MLRNKIALAAAGFIAGVAMTLITLGSVAQPVAADQAENAYMLAQKAGVAHAIYALDNAGLHAIDEGSNAGTIPAGALGKVRQARIAAQSTEWPDGLKEMATNEVTTLKALEEAIRTEDPAQVGPVATKAHDDGHDLSAAVYTWLDTGKAPEMGAGHGH
jgi:hypothetical protein